MAGWMGFRPGAGACRFLCEAGRRDHLSLFSMIRRRVPGTEWSRNHGWGSPLVAHARGFLCPEGRKDLVLAQDPRRHIGGAGRHR